MFRVDRICLYILMLGLIFLIPSVYMITFTDELCSYSLLTVAFIDCIVNNNWMKYKLLFLLLTIFTFYAFYSIYFLDNNTTYFIIKDWAIELKPYIPFAVFLAVNPKPTEFQKRAIRKICFINSAIISFSFLCGPGVIKLLVFHPTYAAVIIFLSSLFLLYYSVDSNGNVDKKTLGTVIVFFTFALLSFKAKYYAIYVLSLYFLFIYKPGVMRHFTTGHALGLIAIGALILAVTWNKIEYYFLTGNSETFDPSAIYSFARPVLYITGFMILIDHFPFGSGLASFASSTSAENYSNVYYEYGINTVHGLAPNSDAGFFCDAFYPSLAQFGMMGVILFIYFWIYAYSFLRILIRTDSKRYKIPFIVGSLCICFILAESIAATTFTNNTGLIATSLLGIVCAKGREIKLVDKQIFRTISLRTKKI